MALKQVMLSSQIDERNKTIEELETQLKEIETRSNEIMNEYKAAEKKEDVNKIADLLEEDTKLEEKRSGLETTLKTTRTELTDLQNELNELKQGERTNVSVKDNKDKLDKRDMFNRYLHTRDISQLKEEGFTTSDGEAIIPKEYIYTPYEEKKWEQDLLDFINVVPVTMSSGTWPVVNKTTAELSTVEELEENPNLAKMPYTNVDYKVETYRGQLPISQEMIDDAGFDILAYLGDHLERIRRNTTNHLTLEAVKKFDEKEVSTLDELKKILEIDIERSYNKVCCLSQTAFYTLSILKDANGRDLINPDPTEPTIRRLYGYPVLVFRDDLIGEETGDAVGFLGDLESAVTFFNRKQFTAKWEPHIVYGQVLMIGFRGQIRDIDKKSGFYIKFKEDKKLSADPEAVGVIRIATK